MRRLSARHDMRTRLDRRVPHGTTASVLLPAGLVADLPEANWSGTQTVVFPQAPRSTAVAEAPAQPRHRAGLPTREPAPPKPAPARRPQPGSMVGGTTASGLPRRVSHSLKNPQGQAASAQSAAEPTPAEDRAAGHEKPLAEAFALNPDVPLVTCDARDKTSVLETLQELVSYTLSLAEVSEGGGSAPRGSPRPSACSPTRSPSSASTGSTCGTTSLPALLGKGFRWPGRTGSAR
nr:hypothetical protein [Amycolatopsis methanolica]